MSRDASMKLLPGVLVAALAGACTPMALHDTQESRQIQDAAPSVEWDKATRMTADVTCDGEKDTAILGYRDDQVWFGVLAAGASKPKLFTFQVGQQTRDSFCELPVKMNAHPMTCVFEDGQGVPGCEIRKGCSEVTLSDGACDSFHFFWNSAQQALVWRRS